VPQTWADVQRAREILNYNPDTVLSDGLGCLNDWMVEKGECSGVTS